MPTVQKVTVPHEKRIRSVLPKPVRMPQPQSEIRRDAAGTIKRFETERPDRSLAHCCPNTWWP